MGFTLPLEALCFGDVDKSSQNLLGLIEEKVILLDVFWCSCLVFFNGFKGGQVPCLSKLILDLKFHGSELFLLSQPFALHKRPLFEVVDL